MQYQRYIINEITSRRLQDADNYRCPPRLTSSKPPDSGKPPYALLRFSRTFSAVGTTGCVFSLSRICSEYVYGAAPFCALARVTCVLPFVAREYMLGEGGECGRSRIGWAVYVRLRTGDVGYGGWTRDVKVCTGDVGQVVCTSDTGRVTGTGSIVKKRSELDVGSAGALSSFLLFVYPIARSHKFGLTTKLSGRVSAARASSRAVCRSCAITPFSRSSYAGPLIGRCDLRLLRSFTISLVITFKSPLFHLTIAFSLSVQFWQRPR
jgi:hypothetical protein